MSALNAGERTIVQRVVLEHYGVLLILLWLVIALFVWSLFEPATEGDKAWVIVFAVVLATVLSCMAVGALFMQFEDSEKDEKAELCAQIANLQKQIIDRESEIKAQDDRAQALAEEIAVLKAADRMQEFLENVVDALKK